MATGETNVARHWVLIAVAGLFALPGFALAGGASISTGLDTLMLGIAILAAAFLLSWGAEVAQLDISRGLAIAFLAFIAVLPEYAVDLVFAWKAGREDALAAADCGVLDCRELAIANMTGSNRLLIGLGWATVVLVWYARSRSKEVRLPSERAVELGFMVIATAWAAKMILLGRLDLIDTVVLVALFGWYIWHAAVEEGDHTDLVGPPIAIGMLPVARRRVVTIVLFAYAAAAILASAEPFAEGLVRTGERFGIDSFLLVQWLAPLASESPEMIVAVLFVLRAKPADGLGALISSKVNQWTLLIGTLPLVYAIAYGSPTQALHLSDRQVEELVLTAAQSLFAAAVLANLSISRGEAAMLLALFIAQFGFPAGGARYAFAAVYATGLVVLLARDPSARRGLARAVGGALSRPRRG